MISSDFEDHRKHSNFLNSTHRNLNSIHSHISSHPVFWLLIAFFLIQCLVITVTRNSPPCFADWKSKTASVSDAVTNRDETQSESSAQANVHKCPFGKVYVYNLPSTFNDDLLLRNCSDLDPYNWQCGIATNHGFGGPAAELRTILPENLLPLWYRTNQFSLELIFHRRILQHPCRISDPDSAAAFYIPFYGGLAIGKYLWIDDVAKRDRSCKLMLDWITKQKFWKRSNGSDHFLALGRITWDFRRLSDPDQKWGSDFLNLPAMKKVTRFIIEKAVHDDHDVAVPYPTGFHPRTKHDLRRWQDFVRAYNRTRLFTFAGATRRSATDVRGILQSHCRNESESCWLVDCSVENCAANSSAAFLALLGSDFCLQPTGDSATRKSVFDCMVAGSVPVFFRKETAYEQYEGFVPGDPGSYSVYIDQEEVRSGSLKVKEVLMSYGTEEIRKKREKVIETIPRIVYGDWEGGFLDFKDAFEIAVEGVLERIKEEAEWEGFL